MRILLVGGFGFIGRHLINDLAGSHSLVVLDTVEAEKIPGFRLPEGATVEQGDIIEGLRVRQVMLKHRPKVVIHLAALTGIGKCGENPSLAFLVNVLGTYNVVMGCIASGSKMLFVSSREVYGESRRDRTREDDPLMPNNIYGVTKMLGEQIVMWAGLRHNLDYTILRLTNVYGPGGDQYNVQAMAIKALTRRKIEILGGSQVMNLVYVEDVADVIRRCLDHPLTSKQAFNVGSNDNLSVEEIVKRLVAHLDIPVRIVRHPLRAGETLSFEPSLDKLERVLGYKAKTDFATGLYRTIEWCKRNLSSRRR